jgi:uncharacterized protein (TIGR03435 family)
LPLEAQLLDELRELLCDQSARRLLHRINFFGHGHMEGRSALMSNLARSLGSESEIADRPVVDKTGLTGGV